MKEYNIISVPLAAVTRLGSGWYWQQEEERSSAIVIEKALSRLARGLSRLVPADLAKSCEIKSMRMIEEGRDEVCMVISLLASADIPEKQVTDFLELLRSRIREACQILDRIGKCEHPERISVVGGSASTTIAENFIKVQTGVDVAVSCLREIRSSRVARTIPSSLGGSPQSIPVQPEPKTLIDEEKPAMDRVRVRGVMEPRGFSRIEFCDGKSLDIAHDPAVERFLIEAQLYKKTIEIKWNRSYRWTCGLRVAAGGVIIGVAPDPQLAMDETLFP